MLLTPESLLGSPFGFSGLAQGSLHCYRDQNINSAHSTINNSASPPKYPPKSFVPSKGGYFKIFQLLNLI